MGFSGQFSVVVEGNGRTYPPFVFTYVDGIGFSSDQVISTDRLRRYSETNYSMVKAMNRSNGCVEAHNEGNRLQLNAFRKSRISKVKIKRIYPTYL